MKILIQKPVIFWWITDDIFITVADKSVKSKFFPKIHYNRLTIELKYLGKLYFYEGFKQNNQQLLNSNKNSNSKFSNNVVRARKGTTVQLISLIEEAALLIMSCPIKSQVSIYYIPFLETKFRKSLVFYCFARFYWS